MRKIRGFTLVELVLYVSVLSVVAGTLTGIFIISSRVQDKENASIEVSQQLDLTLSTIQRLVRDSSLVEEVYEGAVPGTGCSTYCTLLLRTESSSTDPIIVSSDANGIYIQEAGGPVTQLTTDKITVNNFQLAKSEIAGGHANVQINASFTYNSPNPQLAITKSLQSAVGRASAATFDSDLLPNLDDAYDVGQTSPNLRWQDAAFSQNVSVGGSLNVDGSLFIPSTSTAAVSSAGEIEIDTTDDQFLYYGTGQRVINYKQQKGLIVTSPTDADNFVLWRALDPITITDIECIIDPADTGESVVIDVQEANSSADSGVSVDSTITCDNDGASDDGSLSNGAIDANDWLLLDIGAVSGTVTELSVTVYFIYDVE